MNKNKKYFLIYVVNILLGLLYISPLIWMVVSAFKPENRIFCRYVQRTGSLLACRSDLR